MEDLTTDLPPPPEQEANGHRPRQQFSLEKFAQIPQGGAQGNNEAEVLDRFSRGSTEQAEFLVRGRITERERKNWGQEYSNKGMWLGRADTDYEIWQNHMLSLSVNGYILELTKEVAIGRASAYPMRMRQGFTDGLMRMKENADKKEFGAK